jgi:hypothetical protein
MHIHLSLRIKLIASIVSVIIALVLPTLIDLRDRAAGFHQRFRDEAMRVAKELSAGSAARRSLTIGGHWYIRSMRSKKRALISVRSTCSPAIRERWSVAASDEIRRPHTQQPEVTSLMRGRTFADEEQGWDAITAGDHAHQGRQAHHRRPPGLISWEAAQQDEAGERRKMLLTQRQR